MTPRGRCECCPWEGVTFLEIAWEGELGSQEEPMGGPASQAGCHGSPTLLLAEASSHSSSRGTQPSHPWVPLRAVATGRGPGGGQWGGQVTGCGGAGPVWVLWPSGPRASRKGRPGRIGLFLCMDSGPAFWSQTGCVTWPSTWGSRRPWRSELGPRGWVGGGLLAP